MNVAVCTCNWALCLVLSVKHMEGDGSVSRSLSKDSSGKSEHTLLTKSTIDSASGGKVLSFLTLLSYAVYSANFLNVFDRPNYF